MKVLDKLFTLVVKLSDGSTVRVNAFDTNQFDETTGKPWSEYGHHRIVWEAKHTYVDPELGKTTWTVFPIGDFDGNVCAGDQYVGIPSHESIDGDYAKGAVLSHLALKPGDTDSEFFESYNEDQRDFCSTYGEELTMVCLARYGEV